MAIGLVVLIGANLVPLGGVVFFGWGTFAVVFLYWLENVVICVFHVAGIVVWSSAAKRGEMSQKAYDRLYGFGHLFGFFTFIQGFLVVGMLGPLFRHPELAKVYPDGSGFSFNPPPGAVMEALAEVMSFSLVIAILALVAEHAYAFLQDVKSRHYLRVTAPELFVRVGRFIPLHLAIILGAIWMVVHKLSHSVVFVLVALKIIVDVVGYLWEHRLSRAREEQGML